MALVGVAAANPAPPALTRNMNVWEISLAQIRVNGGTLQIFNSNITDERHDEDVCGFMMGDFATAGQGRKADTALQTVTSDSTMTGLGTVASPLHVSNVNGVFWRVQNGVPQYSIDGVSWIDYVGGGAGLGGALRYAFDTVNVVAAASGNVLNLIGPGVIYRLRMPNHSSRVFVDGALIATKGVTPSSGALGGNDLGFLDPSGHFVFGRQAMNTTAGLPRTTLFDVQIPLYFAETFVVQVDPTTNSSNIRYFGALAVNP